MAHRPPELREAVQQDDQRTLTRTHLDRVEAHPVRADLAVRPRPFDHDTGGIRSRHAPQRPTPWGRRRCQFSPARGRLRAIAWISAFTESTPRLETFALRSRRSPTNAAIRARSR